jgi:hypothetical protein
MTRILIASLTILLALIGLTRAASADTQYCIDNPESRACIAADGEYDPRYNRPPPPPPGIYDPDLPERLPPPRPPGYGYGGRLSCAEAGDGLREFGYRRIRPIDCVGRVYGYQARRGYGLYRLSVSARSGRIVGVTRLR